jgi:hypothetical protein
VVATGVIVVLEMSCNIIVVVVVVVVVIIVVVGLEVVIVVGMFVRRGVVYHVLVHGVAAPLYSDVKPFLVNGAV